MDQQQNNSGGGGNGTLTTVLIIGVLGLGGYMVYQAGKKTAAGAAAGTPGASAVYPGTNIPVTHPATNKTVTGSGAGGAVSGITGLLNSIVGLFGKNKTKTTTVPTHTTTTGGGINTGQPAGSGGGSGSGSGGEMMGDLVDNNWNDEGGYMYQFPDRTQDYYLADGTYAGSSDAQGNWVPAQGSGSSCDSGSGSGNSGGGEMTGDLVDNNWNDEGGYMYQFPDRTQDYYLADGTYAGSSDAQGNWVPAN